METQMGQLEFAGNSRFLFSVHEWPAHFTADAIKELHQLSTMQPCNLVTPSTTKDDIGRTERPLRFYVSENRHPSIPLGFCHLDTISSYEKGEAAASFHIELKSIFVLPSHRDRGLGSLLTKTAVFFAVNHLQTFGCHLSSLSPVPEELSTIDLYLAADLYSEEGEHLLDKFESEFDEFLHFVGHGPGLSKYTLSPLFVDAGF